MAKELLIDFYDCNVLILNDINKLKLITKKIVEGINSKIVEETWHCFSPVGVTYVAVIAKSHVAIHTWPEKKVAAIDIFSCDDVIPDNFILNIQNELEAKNFKIQTVLRNI
ncbi:MAG: adenosylmethionine decarboxylase [Bacteroidales bacterium]|jgi:S-adenosylmethionine decarboxylase proenzyme|nr:adenosylmethionine decarboxylase [Bacteroidales bacterium]